MAKADHTGPFKEFVFEDWLREGVEGFCEELKDAKKEFNSENFRKHLRDASKEQLLAVRNFIDNAIEFLDKEETGEKKA
ncbi:MAG: hypothetical protein KDI79_05145 [Anaerolineae bacterium]|nr:hypothetical protein [Anaerolineae bacterium]